MFFSVAPEHCILLSVALFEPNQITAFFSVTSEGLHA